VSSELFADLVDRYDPDDGRDPHRQPAVLRCALHKHVCSLRETADAISETFDTNVSKSAVHRAKEAYDIRDAVTEGVFADVLDGTDETEPGQPSSFFVSRPNDTPVHPFDADCFEPVPMEDTSRNDIAPLTPRFRLPTDSQSTESPTHTSNPNSDPETGVYKDRSEMTPSTYRVTKQHRDGSLVAPPSAPYSGDFPAKYVACGCGNCEERHFLDGDGGPINCPAPVPVTLAGARRIYRKAEGANVATDRAGNDVQRGRQQYAKTMKADSAVFRAGGPNPTDGDGFTANGPLRTETVTTVLVSLRPSPLDANDRLVTPYRLIQDTKDAWAEARDEIPRNVGNGRISHVWTFAGTDTWATPHVHWYGYYHDPDDDVDRSDFAPMITRYLNAAAFGSTESHVKIDAADDLHGGPAPDDGDSAEETVGRDTRGGPSPRGETTEGSAAAPTPADDVPDKNASTGETPVRYDPDDVTLTDGVVRVESDPLLADPERLSANTSTTGVFDDILCDEKGADRLTDGDVQSRGAIYLATQLPKLALHRAEPDAAVEMAAFTDVAGDGRHTFGTHNLGKLADSLDALRQFEIESTP